MAPYIYTERKGIYIIDLKQTLGFFEKAYDVVRDVASKGGTVLFVGTKKQAQEVIEREALRCGMPYVNHRWVGGLLTNFSTIRGRVERLKELRELFESDDIHNYTKKELAKISKEKEKLEKYFKGIVNMEEQPDLMVVIDINKEENAVHEANIKNIPVVALVDTNCDPIPIDYIIPGNDDAIKAITLVVSKLADAVIEGREGYSEATGEAENADATGETDEKENENNENKETEIVEEEL
jgi:small subunit ribosomal protein S2